MPRLLPFEPRIARKIVAGCRLSMALAWIAPRRAAPLFGVPNSGDNQRDYWLRLFTTRAVALGTLALTGGPDQHRMAVQLGVGVDSVDTVAAYLALRRRQLPRATAVVYVLLGFLFVAADLTALGESEPPEK